MTSTCATAPRTAAADGQLSLLTACGRRGGGSLLATFAPVRSAHLNRWMIASAMASGASS